MIDKLKYVFSIALMFLQLYLNNNVFAQCPMGTSCSEAYVFCFNELNNFSCTNSSSIPSGCNPTCKNNGGGIPYGTSWFAFISPGAGNITLTFTVGNCVPGKPLGGARIGIYGDCACNQDIWCDNGCVGPNGSGNYYWKAEPCKIYYIAVDGCATQSACDFSITTKGGTPVNIIPGHINNIISDIIEPVCAGSCEYTFFVDPLPSCQAASFKWTLDGVEVGGKSNEIKLFFPTPGDFKLCVTAGVLNPFTGNLCAEQAPVCTIVKVRPVADRYRALQTLCYEEVANGGYKWHSNTIVSSGIYHETFLDNNCCKYDSIAEFRVLDKPVGPEVYYITCNNTPYVDALNRNWFPCIQAREIILPKSTTGLYKCDSSITLTAVNVDIGVKWSAHCLGSKIELSPNVYLIKECNVGETYDFEYRWFKKNDTLQKTLSTDEKFVVDLKNEVYCVDIMVRTQLGTAILNCNKIFCESIDESKSGNTFENATVYACDSATYNGKVYSKSDSFTQRFINVAGCDSIVFTNLIVTSAVSSNLFLKECDSVNINGKIYTSSGLYTQILKSNNGCDSLLKLDLQISKSNVQQQKLNACDSIVLNGNVYKISGIYPQVFISSNGCDSIIQYNLSIAKSSYQDLYFSACDSIIYNGKIYKQSGDYVEKYQSSSGCDSSYTLHINIPNSNVLPYVVSSCDSIQLNNNKFTQSGKYTQVLKSSNGCDSILNIDLTILKSNAYNYNLTSCDSAIINGVSYLQSGNYVQTLQNVNFCDSSLFINLNISRSTSGDTLFRSCDSVKINGITYNQTGIYQQKLINSIQCDSLLIIDFTRLSKSSTALNYKSCDSIVVNNQVFKQSGNYTQILSNANQCDSVLNLNIKIGKNNSSSTNLSACDSLNVNGLTYYQSGNYSQDLTNSDFCDSTLNLNLSIYKSSITNYSVTACDSININKKIYTQSGSYYQVLKDVHQCDSSVNIQLGINTSTRNNLIQNACDSITINGNTYFSSGSFLQRLINSKGCDSLLTLDLSIKPGNPSSLDAGADTSICEGQIIRLNGNFSGKANFIWHSMNGNFDHPNEIYTNYYSSTIGDEQIYLQASDDCKQWLDSLAIHVLPNQIVQVSGDTIIDPCKKIISFTASGGSKYIWTPTSLVECLDPLCSRVILKSNDASRFTISTEGPCAVPASLNLSLSKLQSDVYLPNVFSPNGDNLNDVFIPVFNCDAIDFYLLQIFDRWGNLVFESSNKDKGWNGKFKEFNVNPAVYPYVIQYQVHGAERKVKYGDVTLLK